MWLFARVGVAEGKVNDLNDKSGGDWGRGVYHDGPGEYKKYY